MTEQSSKRLIHRYEKGEPVPIETHECAPGPGDRGLSGRIAFIDKSGRPIFADCFDCDQLIRVNQSALEIYDLVKVTKSR